MAGPPAEAAASEEPLTPAEALANVESLAELPHVRFLSEERGFLEAYREVATTFPIRGNLVPDAHLAVLLRQHGAGTLYTRDGDFKRFDFLDVRGRERGATDLSPCGMT
jgi:predicted nucleic acid-binding protein